MTGKGTEIKKLSTTNLSPCLTQYKKWHR